MRHRTECHIISKSKWIIGIVLLSLCSLLLVACGQTEPAPAPDKPEEAIIQNATDARDAAIAYLQTLDSEAPDPGANWQETDVTTPGLVGGVKKQYTADDWTISIAYNVVRPDLTEYHVIISNENIGFIWESTVKADSTVTEKI